MRTLEERIKFDHGLIVGENLVKLSHKGRERLALVTIGKRGKVSCLLKPTEGCMYSSSFQIKGNDTSTKGGGVIVWGARNPEIMEMFEGEVKAKIEIEDE